MGFSSVVKLSGEPFPRFESVLKNHDVSNDFLRADQLSRLTHSRFSHQSATNTRPLAHRKRPG